jgi:hypothetical protein
MRPPPFIALAALAAMVGPGCFNQSSPPSGKTIDASTDVAVIFDAATVDASDGSTPALRWRIAAVAANFDQATFSTQYTVAITGNTQGSTMAPLPGAMTVSWRLQLQLVDAAGAPNPTNPGSGAAVDIGCTNAGVGTPNPLVDNLKPTGTTANDVFSWFHPDAASSTPPGKYACNHADEGPSGHQGLITAVVSDGVWQCTATYKGTNTSTATSVTDGTASQPVCKAL